MFLLVAILAVLNTIEISYFTVWIFENLYVFQDEYNKLFRQLNLWFFIILMSLTLLPALLVLYRLFSKGTSKNLKKMILYRTTMQLLFYFIFAGSMIKENINYNDNLLKSQNTFLRVAGIPLSLVYLFEPYVFQVFRKEIAQLTGFCFL